MDSRGVVIQGIGNAKEHKAPYHHSEEVYILLGGVQERRYIYISYTLSLFSPPHKQLHPLILSFFPFFFSFKKKKKPPSPRSFQLQGIGEWRSFPPRPAKTPTKGLSELTPRLVHSVLVIITREGVE